MNQPHAPFSFSSRYNTTTPIAKISKVKGIYIGKIELNADEVAKVNGVFLDGQLFQSHNEPTEIEIYRKFEKTIKYYNISTSEELTVEEFSGLSRPAQLGFTAVKIYEYSLAQKITPQILAKIETKMPEFVKSMQSIDGDLLNPVVYFSPREVWVGTIKSIMKKAMVSEEDSADGSGSIFTFKLFEFDNSKLSIHIYEVKSRQRIFSKEVWVGKGVKQGIIEDIESEVEELINSISREIKPIVTKERPDQLTYLKMLELLRGLEVNLTQVDPKISTSKEYKASLNQIHYIVKMINFEVELKENESTTNTRGT